ncbi:type II secretory pathway protein [Iodobacter sp. CM08]|uniref:type II secretion system protein GspD n=1 Tax=Iodobacter sp. CM08 TaxID=3085902 RepID=UPI0029829235|nr:type II secretory pathway protein [Iodobacter sp. CM08]MDW5415655.1 type II secretory pathway protein [Iodobacter sp. CM08]
MKRVFLIIILLLSSAVNSAQLKPVKFDFQQVSVAQVVGLVYLQALHQQYVISPEVLRDERVVSFRFESDKGDLRQFWRAFLDSLGIAVETRNGIDFVSIKKQEASLLNHEVFVYRPKYRSLPYLVDLLSSVFRNGAFSVQRAVKTQPGEQTPANPPPASAAGMIQNQQSDMLIFDGSPDEILKLKQLLAQVDIASGEVMVSGIIYEVSTTKTDGSAFSLALNLLGGKFSLNLGVKTLENSIQFSNATIDAVASALSTDTRFKIVTSPRLRVRSGANSRLMVGQEVPILGTVSYPQGSSTPVRSVEYRSSGVIFDLNPTVRESVIDLDIAQQLSNFVKTDNGVNDSPTLIKRELRTSVSVQDGEVILLGGLSEDKETTGQSGLSFFPIFPLSKSGDKGQTEFLLILKLQKL